MTGRAFCHGTLLREALNSVFVLTNVSLQTSYLKSLADHFESGELSDEKIAGNCLHRIAMQLYETCGHLILYNCMDGCILHLRKIFKNLHIAHERLLAFQTVQCEAFLENRA